MAISLVDIFAARKNIMDLVIRTPLVQSPDLSKLAQTQVYLKIETYQKTGSFKLRGATNAIARVKPGQAVITASTGNHGRALAYAASQHNIQANICLSNLVPGNKVEAIKASGANLFIHGDSQDDALDYAITLAQREHMALIPPFDHPDVIAGQGTIGLEIIEQLPETATIVIPLSGGGLLAGIAMAVKSIKPQITIIGVTMDQGCAMHTSLQAGHPVNVTEQPTLADSLGGGIGINNKYTFALVQKYCDTTILVDEPAIAQAIVHTYMVEREIIEGAAAVGIAALFSGQLDQYTQNGPMVLLLTGKNIDMHTHAKLIAGTSRIST